MSFSCEDKDADTLAFMTRTNMEVREPIKKATIPLFAELDGEWMNWATGVLLQVGDKHFILTAAHVFDAFPMRPIPVNITDGVVGNSLFPVGDVTLRRSPTAMPGRRLKDDPFDICVCDISNETADKIVAGQQFRFLELKEAEPWGENDTHGWYMVLGFPTKLNEEDVGPNVLGSVGCAYGTFIYLGERGMNPLKHHVPDVQILMDYGPDTTCDDDGKSVSPPPPYGMSGGGMWRVADRGINMSDWTTQDLKLIGIQSSVVKKEQVLKGTRIEHALGFIYRGHGDLQPEIERHFGEEECRKRLIEFQTVRS